jgi:dipeptidyl aminopeptidase/acylaminoacyl peptidase
LIVIDAARQPDQPWTLATGLAAEADIFWSPDGEAVATVLARSPGALLVVRVEDGARTRIPVSPALELRDLAWAPDGRSMLVTGRAPADEFFGLFEVDLQAGTARRVASFRGDISDPLYHPDGRSIAFHVSVDGDLQLVACDRRGAECQALGWTDGRTGMVDFLSHGDSVVVVHIGRASPPGLYAIPIGGGDPVPVYSRRAQPVAGPAVVGVRIDVRSPDGLRIPAYLWRAPERSGPPAALIRIHGGPAAQATPAWDPGIQYLVRAGFDVIQLNYRGSTGYGASFEKAAGGESARVLDVLAAKEYAVRTLGVDPKRVVLYGHSYGAVLATRAAAVGPEACGPVIIVAITRDTPSRARSRRGCSTVFIFHGDRDPLPPTAALAFVRTSLGRSSGSPSDRFRAFADEGHAFQRIETWAEVYASTTKLLFGAD